MDSVHERIRRSRRIKDLTGAEVAERLGISPQYYYNIERGRRKLSAESAIALAEIFEVSIDYLLGQVEYKPYPPVDQYERMVSLIPFTYQLSEGPMEDRYFPDNIQNPLETLLKPLFRVHGIESDISPDALIKLCKNVNNVDFTFGVQKALNAAHTRSKLGFSETMQDNSSQENDVTIAAHHDGEEWTEKEMETIQRFKEFIKSERKEGK